MAEKSVKALSIFRRIISEIRTANKDGKIGNETLKFLESQMRDHKLTQKIFGKASNEVEHLASCYGAYLTSTRQLEELQNKYAGKEKSVQESANLVGLALPKNQKI